MLKSQKPAARRRQKTGRPQRAEASGYNKAFDGHPEPTRRPAMAEPATRWGFVGGGKMATALIRGMVRAGTARADQVVASDPLPAARASLATETGAAVTDA